MDEFGYLAAPPAIRERIDAYMLARWQQLDVLTAAAIDAVLTATGGPMLRVTAMPKRGKRGVPDTRTLDVDVMLPDLDDETWRVWFTVRLRGAYVRDLAAMLTAQVPDHPGDLAGPQEGTQSR